MKKRIILLLMVVALCCSGCAATGAKVTSELVTEVGAAGQNFDKQMTAFLQNWPYLSGVLEGYFYNRTSEISLAMREAREKLDGIYARGQDGKWEKRDLGLAFGYSCNLFNLAVREWMLKIIPELLKIVPGILG